MLARCAGWGSIAHRDIYLFSGKDIGNSNNLNAEVPSLFTFIKASSKGFSPHRLGRRRKRDKDANFSPLSLDEVREIADHADTDVIASLDRYDYALCLFAIRLEVDNSVNATVSTFLAVLKGHTP